MRKLGQRSSGGRTRGQAGAVRPFVVAGREDQGYRRSVEERPTIGIERVVARILAALDVAGVQNEAGSGLRRRGQERRQFAPLAVGIGRIADDRKGPRLAVGGSQAQASSAAGSQPLTAGGPSRRRALPRGQHVGSRAASRSMTG